MQGIRKQRTAERGTLLLVVVFIATSIAGLAALISGRVVSETKQQEVLEHETRAFNGAYAQINMAMNIVNTSAYNEKNHNVALRNAINGVNGGTVDLTGIVETGGESLDDVKTQVTGEEYVYYYDKKGQVVEKRKYKPGGVDSGYRDALEKSGDLLWQARCRGRFCHVYGRCAANSWRGRWSTG